MIYSYVKAADIPRLTQEILGSSITIKLEGISLDGTALDIEFAVAISAAEKTVLDALVVAHVATPLPDVATGTSDSDGDSHVRIKEARSGWHVQPHFINFRTSVLDGLNEKDKDKVDLGWSTHKVYKSVDGSLVEIIDEAEERDAVTTIVEFAPPFDYEINAGEVKVITTPTEDCFLYPTVVPDLTPAQGGTKFFATGGIDLRALKAGVPERVSSAASKYMAYQVTGLPDGWANKIQIHVNHHRGIKVDIQIKLGILAE